ncbi:polypeptide N-acetylgalactosaminyltransferase 10-like [Anneissia japonica]|uniref:polypeptide N-acetylgalactosaminyltransferase 10-like n=1 Tax=Anneissia japonica TaxID=1529436 RepID=UPI001425839A|nr:polypeptide N-acetylgalactosaminyltransferase 10-like [Anneissia japonica]
MAAPAVEKWGLSLPIEYTVIALFLLVIGPFLLKIGVINEKKSQANVYNVRQAAVADTEEVVEERLPLVDNKDERRWGMGSNHKIDWHNYSQIEADKQRQGPGEHGMPVKYTSEMKKTERQDFSANGFNVRVSDMVSLDRSIPDIRNPRCKDLKYSAKLPTTSVIIPFHNEAMSTLQRTVHSVMNRSPPQLLHEIILVDDFSDKPFLREPLEQYMSRFPKVKLLRNARREGLIRTRLAGAYAATGDVILILDSHCEVNVNWLPPLLDRIASNRKRIVCPMIDVIGNDDWHYETQAGDAMRGAFDWELYYKRIPINEEEKKRRIHASEPFRTPIMAGGLFAVDRKYFLDELGGYDKGLDVWGGEQYDLSFKIWMCGGEMEDVPCSRVGHVYRKFMSYSVPGGGNVINKNLMRVVETWMDDWKKYFYERRPYLKGVNFGDISDQMNLKKRLNCHNFTWFMENVAPDILKHYPPVEPKHAAEGQVHSVSSGLCLKVTQGEKSEFDLTTCSTSVTKNSRQYFALTWHDDLRIGSTKFKKCIDFPYNREGSAPIIFPCHGGGGNQLWVYNEEHQLLYHKMSRFCLDSAPSSEARVVLTKCSKTSKTQKWKFDKTDKGLLQKLNNRHSISFES